MLLLPSPDLRQILTPLRSAPSPLYSRTAAIASSHRCHRRRPLVVFDRPPPSLLVGVYCDRRCVGASIDNGVVVVGTAYSPLRVAAE